MTAHHHITWTIEGDWITGHVACIATEGAECRLVCEQGCESWPCTGDDHNLVDSGQCNAVEWFEADGVQECHGGDGRETLRDGPVDVFWTGTCWRWAYRKEASAPQSDLLRNALGSCAGFLSALRDAYDVDMEDYDGTLRRSAGRLCAEIAEALGIEKSPS